MTVKESLISDALKLSEAERLEVAEAIYASLQGPADPDADTAWQEEISSRLDDIDSGRVKLIPWEEGRKKIMGGTKDGDASR